MAEKPLETKQINVEKPLQPLKVGNLATLKQFTGVPILDGRKIANETQDALFNNSGFSLFGSLVFANLVFPAQNVTDLEGNTISLPRARLDGVLMTVTQTKNIVTTPTQGRNGTVKEYISEGDFSISINGVIAGSDFLGFKVSDGNVYPEASVNEMIQIVRAPARLKVVSEFLDLFGISEVVVTDYDFPQTRGTRDNQLFTMQLLSDEPLELQPAGDLTSR